MPTFKTFWFAIISVGCYISGWFFVFRTEKMVAMGRRNYSNKLIQANPFADFVMKPSYPTYIRTAGIFLWVWTAALDYLLITGWLR
jgi:cbb3-type cytochrome oxidase subunit 3